MTDEERDAIDRECKKCRKFIMSNSQVGNPKPKCLGIEELRGKIEKLRKHLGTKEDTEAGTLKEYLNANEFLYFDGMVNVLYVSLETTTKLYL